MDLTRFKKIQGRYKGYHNSLFFQPDYGTIDFLIGILLFTSLLDFYVLLVVQAHCLINLSRPKFQTCSRLVSEIRVKVIIPFIHK